jgi:DNA-directed RNA polymerase subunit M/transcription elongation factor TFIIS
MITIAKVSYIHEADILCMQLEEAGIKAFMPDQHISSMQPLYSGAIGGIRVQIHESDLDQARDILVASKSNIDTGIFQCPKCSSDSVEYENVSKRSAFLSLFLFNMPFTWFKRKCTCKDCGHKWKDKKPNQSSEPTLKTPGDSVDV